MESNDDTDFEIILVEIKGAAAAATMELLPEKSIRRYETVLANFNDWPEKKVVSVIDEDIILAYISEKAKSYNSSSLWSLKIRC